MKQINNLPMAAAYAVLLVAPQLVDSGHRQFFFYA